MIFSGSKNDLDDYSDVDPLKLDLVRKRSLSSIAQFTSGLVNPEKQDDSNRKSSEVEEDSIPANLSAEAITENSLEKCVSKSADSDENRDPNSVILEPAAEIPDLKPIVEANGLGQPLYDVPRKLSTDDSLRHHQTVVRIILFVSLFVRPSIFS